MTPLGIGRAIAHTRRLVCMSQRDLAKITGLHPVSVSKIERGVHDDVGVCTVARIAKVLGVSLGALLDIAEVMSDPCRNAARLCQEMLDSIHKERGTP